MRQTISITIFIGLILQLFLNFSSARATHLLPSSILRENKWGSHAEDGFFSPAETSDRLKEKDAMLLRLQADESDETINRSFNDLMQNEYWAQQEFLEDRARRKRGKPIRSLGP